MADFVILDSMTVWILAELASRGECCQHFYYLVQSVQYMSRVWEVMAESWGLVIILFFLAAFIVFIIKLFVEFPGLLKLSCVYDDNTYSVREIFKNNASDEQFNPGQVSSSLINNFN